MDGPDYAAAGAVAVDDLLHHGVKGMKWGVRRKRGSSSSSTSSDTTVSADHAKAVEHKSTVKKHGTAALSNKDLQDLVTRMNLEQQYSRLSTQNKGAVGKGAKFAAELLANVGKQHVTRLASDALGAQLTKTLKKKGN